MELFLGIDGGGTRTQAVLVREDGRICGRGEAGSSNYHNVGLAVAARNLVAATESAWESTGFPRRPAGHAFLGCAGVRSAADAAHIRAVAESAALAPTGAVTVMNDLHNAVAGGLGGEPGIALISGTGSNCLGRDETGATFMCGGWGWLLDDQGSAMGLALAGLRAVVRAADQREAPTSLLEAALAFLGLVHPDELLARLYASEWVPDEIAAFAPVVMRHAETGDAAAREILESGARSLGEIVAGAAKRLAFADGPKVVVLGGCVRSGPPYQPLVERAVLDACPGARLVEPQHSPEIGAAINVLRVAGVQRESSPITV